MDFINNFRTSDVYGVSKNVMDNIICARFAAGYCYYFAHMLKTAFNRGTVCCTGGSHMVWLDGTNPQKDIAYDIYGVAYEYTCLIPEHAMGLTVQSFKHVKDQTFFANEKTVEMLINKYMNCTDVSK